MELLYRLQMQLLDVHSLKLVTRKGDRHEQWVFEVLRHGAASQGPSWVLESVRIALQRSKSEWYANQCSLSQVHLIRRARAR